uniref:Uncharacterized protein n=1 Tax=Oryza barthii TaxID=65489 RepID=A0A0D3G6S4_9ORYZ
MALALQADCFTSDLSQLIFADVMSGLVPLDASMSISGRVAILGVFKPDKINCSRMPTHPILQWMETQWGDELVVMMGLARELTATAADCFTSDLSQLIFADVMSGLVPLDASMSISGRVAILGVFKPDKINCSRMPTHPILQWMVNDLLTISAPVEGDAMGDELVVMMGLARELTATQ